MSFLRDDERMFDYVIVGAGPSAMGLLYSLLSPFQETDPPFTIAVIERGTGPPHDPLTVVPTRWYEAAHDPNSSVAHIRSAMAGRVLEIPIGKGLGGSSNVNACLCTAPLPQDFESWPTPWRDTTMSSVKAVQEVLKQNGCLHYRSDPENAFNPFDKSLDISSLVPTLSVEDTDGHFERRNFHQALLQPFLDSYPHLQRAIKWFRGMEAQRLLIEGQSVKGVECQNGDMQVVEIMCRKEVILCAGAIETPVILLVSGIGNQVSGVGKNLRDQVILPVGYLTPWRASRKLSSNAISGMAHFNVGSEIFQVAVTDEGANDVILPPVMAMSVRRETENKSLRFLLQLAFRALKTSFRLTIQYTPVGYFLRHFASSALLCFMHPVSSGTVKVDSGKRAGNNTPARRRNVEVIVDVGYLRQDRDVEEFRQAWKTCTKAGRYFNFFSGPIFRLLDACGIDWFRLWLQVGASPYFHFCGTCSMKVEGRSDWVVDSELRVRDFSQIRVCDASIFPSMVSSPPALTCAALGYSFGRMLLKER